MIKYTLTAAALAAVLATPAFAQQAKPMTPPSSPPAAAAPAKPADAAKPAEAAKPSNDTAKQAVNEQKPGFVQSQEADEWRGSKLIGTSVYGPDNKSIGDINDLIVDKSGAIKAAVIGVGGFLGVGEKEVAVPFSSLNVTRKPNSSSIDKITVSFTKDQLKNAPKFAYYQAPKSQTTGSSAGGMARPMGPAGTMK